jgi:drug/metabolite transporter (DMT)-like permease
MATKTWAIFLMIICTTLTSSAQIFYKFGANKLSFNIVSIITNWQILVGLILYGFGGVLMIIAFRGGEVTVLFPIITSSYIWVTLGSSYFFQEIITFLRWIGIFLIIIGILIVVVGEKNTELAKFEDFI